MNRVHIRIDEIKESSIRIEESSKRIEQFVNDIHKVIYGNGRNGLIIKLNNAITKVNLNRWLLGIMILGLFSIVFFVLQNLFIK